MAPTIEPMMPVVRSATSLWKIRLQGSLEEGPDDPEQDCRDDAHRVPAGDESAGEEAGDRADDEQGEQKTNHGISQVLDNWSC